MRLIDADALIAKIIQMPPRASVFDLLREPDEIEVINGMPDIDLVRCKDCIHRIKRPDDVWCSVMARTMFGDEGGYCAWGEREEDHEQVD